MTVNRDFYGVDDVYHLSKGGQLEFGVLEEDPFQKSEHLIENLRLCFLVFVCNFCFEINYSYYFLQNFHGVAQILEQEVGFGKLQSKVGNYSFAKIGVNDIVLRNRQQLFV